MKRFLLLMLMAITAMALAGCGSDAGTAADGQSTAAEYHKISQDEAAKMMEQDDGHIIVDVRTVEEYNTGHIPGAICVPNESIGSEQPAELPDLEQVILVYCRSGNRSKQASKKLAEIGYTNVYEFGGINSWSGKIVTE